MVEDADARLIAEVEPLSVALKHVHHAQALLIVLEAAGIDHVQRPLPRVAERRVAQIVAETDRLRQILVEPQRAGDGSGKARDLQRVGQARAVVIPLRAQEDLRLVLEAAEGLGMRDAVHVPLEAGADLALRLRLHPAARIHRQHPVGADDHAFKLFSLLSRTGHALHRLLKDIRARDFSFPYSYTTQILISLYFFEKIFLGYRFDTARFPV